MMIPSLWSTARTDPAIWLLHWTVGRMAWLESSCSSKENLLHVLYSTCSVYGGAMGAERRVTSRIRLGTPPHFPFGSQKTSDISFFFIVWLTIGDSDSVTVDQGESRWVRGIQVSRFSHAPSPDSARWDPDQGSYLEGRRQSSLVVFSTGPRRILHVDGRATNTVSRVSSERIRPCGRQKDATGQVQSNTKRFRGHGTSARH
ncbi:hypothetical protein JOL62DRAFT_301190 [Phyllosticta paracitricarpa]|uniref:Uncharacterized protein n=1 Tax=Phyllosticta paracitricarpa TaxID=2016321 RepID=A0ABR1NGQ0_9PEZI